MIREMSEAESSALLGKERVGRLGCIVEGFPYVVPVNYVYDGDGIYLHSMPGQKVTAMRENPRVCLQVDRIENDWNWQSVMVRGTYEEITGTTERTCVLGRILASYPSLTPVETIIAEDAGAPAPVVFRIRVEKLSGISEG